MRPSWQMPSSASYAWLPHPLNKVDPMVDNDLVMGRIHRAVDDQLAAKVSEIILSGGIDPKQALAYQSFLFTIM